MALALTVENTMQASDYNPMLPAVQADPYPYYATLREHAPVYFNEQLGWYIVSRYEDVIAITKNPAVFSSARAVVRPEQLDAAEKVAPTAVRAFRRGILLSEDPPMHTRTRSVVTRAFTPKRIAEMEPRIRQLARELISQLPRSGEFDLIKDLAEPLPVIVIAQMMGEEPKLRHEFKRWSDNAVATFYALARGAELSDIERTSQEMHDYMSRALEARRQQPRDDLMQALLDNGVREGVLSVDEAIAFCRLLLVAGNETTTNLLGNGMHALLSHPDQLERLTREPALIPNAVEEMLRYDSAAKETRVTRRLSGRRRRPCLHPRARGRRPRKGEALPRRSPPDPRPRPSVLRPWRARHNAAEGHSRSSGTGPSHRPARARRKAACRSRPSA
ncbi:cytochrome P450 [Cystobacter ferrugineus]|uniref:Cytochrome P450 n=1 Tax=Cystobacter ferrugineus TaxID=83449 RepID=A0A1L9BEG2_9BACT|nr:cytochrome P450 [Cystobacter ferrugineus]OJH40657.1 hypothetical protein BON30_06835 [Cystobacter ferrugineus]